MSEIENTNLNLQSTPPSARQEMALDDARRIKTLSPGMLVFKRFIRNKLAVIGLIILVFMFTFAFLGPLFSPYTETEVFYKQNMIRKDYASAIFNTELRYSVKDGESFGSPERARFLLATSKGEDQFSSGNKLYKYVQESESFYRIQQLEEVAEVLVGMISPAPGHTLPGGFEAAYKAADAAGETTFDYFGTTYVLTRERKATTVSTQRDVAVADWVYLTLLTKITTVSLIALSSGWHPKWLRSMTKIPLPTIKWNIP